MIFKLFTDDENVDFIRHSFTENFLKIEDEYYMIFEDDNFLNNIVTLCHFFQIKIEDSKFKKNYFSIHLIKKT